MFQLAQTAWPRFGGDQAKRSLLTIAGPHTTPHWHTIALPVLDRTPDQVKRTNHGVIVMPDETLRVCHAGMLSALTLDGTILWQVDLRGLVREGYIGSPPSPPPCEPVKPCFFSLITCSWLIGLAVFVTRRIGCLMIMDGLAPMTLAAPRI